MRGISEEERKRNQEAVIEDFFENSVSLCEICDKDESGMVKEDFFWTDKVAEALGPFSVPDVGPDLVCVAFLGSYATTPDRLRGIVEVDRSVPYHGVLTWSLGHMEPKANVINLSYDSTSAAAVDMAHGTGPRTLNKINLWVAATPVTTVIQLGERDLLEWEGQTRVGGKQYLNKILDMLKNLKYRALFAAKQMFTEQEMEDYIYQLEKQHIFIIVPPPPTVEKGVAQWRVRSSKAMPLVYNRAKLWERQRAVICLPEVREWLFDALGLMSAEASIEYNFSLRHALSRTLCGLCMIPEEFSRESHGRCHLYNPCMDTRKK